jgi:phenylpyruvate tautomerase PptA (4-oxalocrotonate tautomerase family)
MPSTLISIRRPRPPAERVAIIEAVQAALVEAIRIAPGDRCVRVQSFDAADFIVAATRSENFTLVEVSMFSGRSMEAMRALQGHRRPARRTRHRCAGCQNRAVRGAARELGTARRHSGV